MRKKSHISLARYIVNSLNDKELKKHRFSFYIGSILPDIKPSFIYKRHEINGTFPYVKKHIARLSEGQKVMNKKGGKYYRDLGQVSQYLADYFTFPHNKIFIIIKTAIISWNSVKITHINCFFTFFISK